WPSRRTSAGRRRWSFGYPRRRRRLGDEVEEAGMDEERSKRRILIVDDEAGVRESLRMVLKDAYEPVAVGSGADALDALVAGPFDVVLLDIVMPGMDGLELLEEVRSRYPRVPVIMLTATKTVKTAVGAMKLGAFDYVTKPIDVDELRVILDKATENAIHDGSPRIRKPLVTLNCAAIPENLLESELFGHEKGSFTDAHQKKLGQFELAHGGSLFLDEIGEMGPGTQAKLLRVLEHGEFLRVGGQRAVTVDVRIIAATNRDLSVAIKDGSFRADLFYRLNVVAVHLPPLRERRDDLVLLIRHFVAGKCRDMAIVEKTIRPEAVDAMLRYPWPGNVRELENLIERVLVLSEGPVISLEDLPDQL